MILKPGHLYTAAITLPSGAEWRAESMLAAKGGQEVDLYRNGYLYAVACPWDDLRTTIMQGYPAEARRVVAALERATPTERPA